MSGKWGLPDVPKRGWRCESSHDLGDLSGTCEMCETQAIRYVHVMRHDNYPYTLDCGQVCAGHMEQDFAAPKERERVLRNTAARRKTWMAKPWQISRNGNPYMSAEGYHMVIFPAAGGFRLRMTVLNSDLTAVSPKVFPTIPHAKLKAFNVIQTRRAV